jgi:hypothetical protein
MSVQRDIIIILFKLTKMMAENIRVYWNELASNKLASSCAEFLFGKEKPK